MVTLLINRIRSGNYILSEVESKGILAWLHNKLQKSDQGNDRADMIFLLFFLYTDISYLC